ERGSRDSWTITPKRVDAVREAAAKLPNAGRGGRGQAAAAGGGDAPAAFGGASSVPSGLYQEILHDPKFRDPRGYIMPSDQPDFPTATRFINSLIKNGIDILQASAPFTAAGNSYP